MTDPFAIAKTDMQKVLAFAGTRNNKTALVVTSEAFPCVLFLVKIKHQGGADSKHSVEICPLLHIAMDKANEWLDGENLRSST